MQNLAKLASVFKYWLDDMTQPIDLEIKLIFLGWVGGFGDVVIKKMWQLFDWREVQATWRKGSEYC